MVLRLEQEQEPCHTARGAPESCPAVDELVALYALMREAPSDEEFEPLWIEFKRRCAADPGAVRLALEQRAFA